MWLGRHYEKAHHLAGRTDGGSRVWGMFVVPHGPAVVAAVIPVTLVDAMVDDVAVAVTLYMYYWNSGCRATRLKGWTRAFGPAVALCTLYGAWNGVYTRYVSCGCLLFKRVLKLCQDFDMVEPSSYSHGVSKIRRDRYVSKEASTVALA
jgi:hypothetical protein